MSEIKTKSYKLIRRQKKETAQAGSSKKFPLKNKDRMNIGVSIKTDLWRKLRAFALTQGRLTGELIDEAIEAYLVNHEKN